MVLARPPGRPCYQTPCPVLWGARGTAFLGGPWAGGRSFRSSGDSRLPLLRRAHPSPVMATGRTCPRLSRLRASTCWHSGRGMPPAGVCRSRRPSALAGSPSRGLCKVRRWGRGMKVPGAAHLCRVQTVAEGSVRVRAENRDTCQVLSLQVYP